MDRREPVAHGPLEFTTPVRESSSGAIEAIPSDDKRHPAVSRLAFTGAPPRPAAPPIKPVAFQDDPAPPETAPFPSPSSPPTPPPPNPLAKVLKPIDQVTLATAPLRVEDGQAIGTPKELAPPAGDRDAPVPAADMIYAWAATALCYGPLYFEEVNPERYGYMIGPRQFQPVYSAAHFFVNVPLMPYKLSLHHPRECIFTLGQYRPGSLVPYRKQRLPLSLPAASVETATIAGLFLVIP